MDKNRKFETHGTNEQDLKFTPPFWRRLSWNLILYFIAFAAIPLAIVGIIIALQSDAQARAQISRQLESVAALKISEVNRWLDDSHAKLNILLATPIYPRLIAFLAASVPDPVEQKILNTFLKDIVETRDANPEDDAPFLELFVYNFDGYIMAASDPGRIGQLVVNQPYFRASLTEETIQPPYYELGQSELTVVITTPLRDDKTNQILGVLAGRLDLGILSQIMSERAGLGDTGETYLVSLESNYLVTPSRFESEGYVLNRAYHSEGIDQALRGENGSAIYKNYREPAVTVIGVYRWLPDLKVGLLAEVAESEALVPFEQVRNFSLGIAAVAILVAIIVGFYSASSISKPITSLTQVATQIGDGDLNQRAQIFQRNEIGLLATAFNTMTERLRELFGTLEDRNRRLAIVATLSERLNAILTLEELLPEVVNQIKDNFGYYYTQIYLFDDKQENLVMAAGTGAAGVELKAKGHGIALNAPTSPVARAARSGEVVQVDNVREVKDWLPNPLLSDTYSEIAVPIVLDGQVIGVLDVHSDKIAGLDESDANSLRSLANQVAVAVRNAHQFAEVQSALAEAHKLQQQYVEQAWNRAKITRRGLNRVDFNLGELTTLDESVINQARKEALKQQEPVVVTITPEHIKANEAGHESSVHQTLVAPVVLRNTTIGNLQLHELDPNRRWTENELAFINAVIDQVAQAAENLRLIEETRERAAREQAIREVTDRLRSAPNLERLTTIAAEELGRYLSATHTKLKLGVEPVTKQK
jgi:GAF domain-containing protein/HAMP domain-containing protein